MKTRGTLDGVCAWISRCFEAVLRIEFESLVAMIGKSGEFVECFAEFVHEFCMPLLETFW